MNINNNLQSENINYENDSYKDFSDIANEKIKDISAELRLGFIRKVYGILTAQLLLTSLLSFIAMTSKSYQNFLLNHKGLLTFFFYYINNFTIYNSMF
jgi:FtsH-binding integral membrane protein